MINRLDHMNFSVRNLEESINWYKKVFNFELVEKGTFDGAPWAIVKSGNAMLAMYERDGANFIDRHETARKGLQGISHFALAVDKLKEWIEKVETKTVDVDHYFEYPHSQSWYVNDPTGYEIEVVYWNKGIKFPS